MYKYEIKKRIIDGEIIHVAYVKGRAMASDKIEMEARRKIERKLKEADVWLKGMEG